MTRSISAKATSGLVRAARCSTGMPARFKRTGLLVQLSGTKRRNATMSGTSPRASVSDTKVWQLAVLLRVPTKPAMHSNLKPAGYSDRKPATLGVNRMGRFDDVVEG